MNIIIAKCLIFLTCLLIQLRIFPITTSFTVVMLFAIIISCFDIVFDLKNCRYKYKKYLFAAILQIFCAFSIFELQIVCYLPVVIFDILSLKLFYCLPLYFICFLNLFFNTNINADININVIYSASAIILLCAISAFIQYETSRNELLYNKLKSLRDSSKEHALIIEERNATLRKIKDNEIYMATLKERNRIAREIHDNVGHLLTRSILLVGALKTGSKNDDALNMVNDLHSTLNTAMTAIRNSVHDLHDESIDLLSAINEIISAIKAFEINLEYDMSKNIPKSIKYCFISVIKEAVNNTVKHSNATKMDIIIREHPAFYQLMIKDNGAVQNTNNSNGIGLNNIKERVNNLKGYIKISTDNGFGILISIMKNNSDIN